MPITPNQTRINTKQNNDAIETAQTKKFPARERSNLQKILVIRNFRNI